MIECNATKYPKPTSRPLHMPIVDENGNIYVQNCVSAYYITLHYITLHYITLCYVICYVVLLGVVCCVVWCAGRCCVVLCFAVL